MIAERFGSRASDSANAATGATTSTAAAAPRTCMRRRAAPTCLGPPTMRDALAQAASPATTAAPRPAMNRRLVKICAHPSTVKYSVVGEDLLVVLECEAGLSAPRTVLQGEEHRPQAGDHQPHGHEGQRGSHEHPGSEPTLPEAAPARLGSHHPAGGRPEGRARDPAGGDHEPARLEGPAERRTRREPAVVLNRGTRNHARDAADRRGERRPPRHRLVDGAVRSHEHDEGRGQRHHHRDNHGDELVHRPQPLSSSDGGNSAPTGRATSH